MFHLAALTLSLALRVLSTLRRREHEQDWTLSCASVAHVETRPYMSHQLPISFIMNICAFWKFLSFKIKYSYACPFPLLLMGHFLMSALLGNISVDTDDITHKTQIIL